MTFATDDEPELLNLLLAHCMGSLNQKATCKTTNLNTKLSSLSCLFVLEQTNLHKIMSKICLGEYPSKNSYI